MSVLSKSYMIQSLSNLQFTVFLGNTFIIQVTKVPAIMEHEIPLWCLEQAVSESYLESVQSRL